MEDNKTLITSADVTEGWISDATASDYYSAMTADNYAQIEHNLSEYEGMTFESSDNNYLKLYDATPILAEFTGDHLFILYNDEGQDLITVNLSDGDITYGENYTPDEAARMFWDSIGQIKVEDVNKQFDDYSNPEVWQVSAPPGIADDMPESYLTMTLLEDAEVKHEKSKAEQSEELSKRDMLEQFDNAMKVID